jgi:hypothetical protein
MEKQVDFRIPVQVGRRSDQLGVQETTKRITLDMRSRVRRAQYGLLRRQVNPSFDVRDPDIGCVVHVTKRVQILDLGPIFSNRLMALDPLAL